MIVGTAGHIDHGKTTLVRALTGVDTDRLPEEKARGMSIELGYAFMETPPDVSVAADPSRPDERIGFIDVPGHDRLVHTMISGATGIDFALILVAADDGVMPQTREHVAVLSLLGLARGAVAITKVDRVERARVDAVRADVDALLAGTTLAGVPVLPVAATTGEGVDALRALLAAAAQALRVRAEDGRGFRLAIDRVFTLAGIGVVVTGTVHAGRVKVGDELALAPSPAGLRVRVRSLHAQDRAVEQAHAGQRCAMAISGIAKDSLERGQWLVAPAVGLSTDRLDAAVTAWRGEAKALRSGTVVHVHLGARDVMATVAVLQAGAPDAAGDSLMPGAGGVVQLVLREPVGAWHGDRLVLRDASASRTVAGGRVLDPFAPARYRRSAQRLAELAAWSAPGAGARLRALQEAATFGVSLGRWAQAEGLAELPDVASAAYGGWSVGATQRESLADAAIAALRSFHAREPDMLGPDAARLRRAALPRLPEAVWAAVLAGLVDDGRVAMRGPFVHLPAHGLELSAIDRRIAQKIAPALAAAGFEGAWARDLAKDNRESEAVMRATLARLGQRGEVHQVVNDLCYAPQVIARLATIARTLAADDADIVTVARFRDAAGLGRKRAVQLLEYFDRIGLLRRVGDTHRLRADSTLYAGGAGG